MSAYLIDHPPRVQQWYARRNRPLTGCTVLHTAESVMDTVGPDTGAENVADFIRTRGAPGSYHDLVDSDSVMHLVPYEHGAFHDGTGSNNWALSISFACRTSDWRSMPREKRAAFLRNGARAFAVQQAYRRKIGAPLTELRLISKAQSDAGQSGFIYHGLRDPGRRSDPGVAAPNLFPLTEFIDHCRAALAGQSITIEEDDMAQVSQTEWREVLDRVRGTSVTVDYALAPEDGFNSKGEVTKRLRGVQADTGAVRAALNAQSGALTALTSLVAEQNGLSIDDVRRVVSEEIARGVDVDVTVQPAG